MKNGTHLEELKTNLDAAWRELGERGLYASELARHIARARVNLHDLSRIEAGGVEGWQPPDGFTLIPTAALEWLHGTGPDEKGQWFGDEPATALAGKFWWRNKFRKLCAAAPPPPASQPEKEGQS